jgi:hypothetical protein
MCVQKQMYIVSANTFLLIQSNKKIMEHLYSTLRSRKQENTKHNYFKVKYVLFITTHTKTLDKGCTLHIIQSGKRENFKIK